MKWLKQLFKYNWGKMLVSAIVGGALTAAGMPNTVVGPVASSAGDAVDRAVDGYGEEQAAE